MAAKKLPPEEVERLRLALQEAANAALHADARDQTAACCVGGHMLGLFPAAQGKPEDDRDEAISRVRDIAYVATAAVNTAASLKPPPSDLVKFVGSSILGSTPRLDFCELGWGATQYATLTAALPGCVALEELTIAGMMLNDADAQAIVAALPPSVHSLNISCGGLTACPDLSGLPALRVLSFGGCPDLETPPDVSALRSLVRLDLFGCTKLKVPPVVSVLTESLQIINLANCSSLEALPDVSAVGGLRALVEPTHLKT